MDCSRSVVEACSYNRSSAHFESLPHPSHFVPPVLAPLGMPAKVQERVKRIRSRKRRESSSERPLYSRATLAPAARCRW
jgi:hypothetical protein